MLGRVERNNAGALESMALFKTWTYACQRCDWYVVLLQSEVGGLARGVPSCPCCGARKVRPREATWFERLNPVESLRGAAFQLLQILGPS